MSGIQETIICCPACGVSMDVSGHAPFTNVVCPQCAGTTRVKCQFGPYTLVRRHAVGGMSMVFVAHDATLDREVALKILSENYSADERRIAAFEEEARVTASFNHPNVVRVFKTGRAFGRFYIAMELVPGGHFEHWIHERGKVPELEVLPLAIEVAQGLRAAHAAGLIHRDVKPGNILLDGERHAKLVDFGLALVTQGGKATATELWATPYYVPPETVEGQVEDFRSDIYAFGATLYHALSGKPSCAEESMATDRLREAKKSVVPLSVAAPSLSAETCRIVERAMAYSPDGRFASYDEMITDLTHALAGLKSGTAFSTAAPRRGGGGKRGKPFYLTSSAALLVAAAGAWFVWQRVRDEPLPQAPRPAAGVVISEPEDMVFAAEIARNYREASAAVEAGDYEAAQSGFGALHANPRVQEPTRSWAGLQALLAAMLDARPEDAIKQLRPMREHLRNLPAGHPLASREWDALLGKMQSLQPLPATEARSAAGVIANMLAGLKNWDQGLLDPAAACFRAAQSAKLSQDDAWATIYQKLAASYLHDHRILTGALFDVQPADAKECLSLIDRLDEALALMKTRGRARFNVRSWQLDLKRREKFFEAAAARQVAASSAPAAEPVADLAARLDEFTREWRFAEAAAWLKDLPDDAPLAGRASLISLTGSAAAFLSDIGQDLAIEPFTGEVPLADGGTATLVTVDDGGAVLATMATGEERSCKWSDFSADAMIAMHRVLVKKPPKEIERLRRHECAISFDWLVGNRERARAAAANLSQSTQSFKQRWEAITKELPE
jgi:tRNA A-37 threonylcarbamoyl transferase component Bud32